MEPCQHVNATEARNILCQMMVVLDNSIGQFVEDLKAKEMWDNTIVWVSGACLVLTRTHRRELSQ